MASCHFNGSCSNCLLCIRLSTISSSICWWTPSWLLRSPTGAFLSLFSSEPFSSLMEEQRSHYLPVIRSRSSISPQFCVEMHAYKHCRNSMATLLTRYQIIKTMNTSTLLSVCAEVSRRHSKKISLWNCIFRHKQAMKHNVNSCKLSNSTVVMSDV